MNTNYLGQVYYCGSAVDVFTPECRGADGGAFPAASAAHAAEVVRDRVRAGWACKLSPVSAAPTGECAKFTAGDYEVVVAAW